ncbi:MAG: phage holin family protein [Acidimicrobiia bacterium]|nr:phage holin family protein [Acidimicrobiia bacterium]
MTRTKSKPVSELAEELRDLVTAYVRQETIEPAKQLGRNFGLSLAAGFVLGTAFVLLVIAVIRFAQTELFEAGADEWSSAAPYLIGFVVAIAVVVFSLTMVRGSARGSSR